MDRAGTDIARFYEMAFEEADMAILISNPEGRSLAVNPEAISLTGYSRRELVGNDILDLFQTDDHVPEVNRDHIPTGKTQIAEGRLECKDGGLLPVELRIRKLADGSFFQTLLDITERQLANETLKKEEELFRIAFDQAPTGMSIIAPDGVTYLAVNPLLCEMFGYTREEFIGQTIHLVTHPDDEELSNEWILKKMNDEPCEPVLEKRYIHRNGHIVWGLVSAHWIKNDDGSRRMAVCHIQDITARKKAEEERKNLQLQLAAVLESAHLGHWEYDVENDTFTFSDQFYRIFQTSTEAVGGYTMSSSQYASRFIHPDDRHILHEEIRNAVETSDPDFSKKTEHRMLYDDGSIGHISVHFFCEKNEQNRTIKTYGISQDITDRIRAEQERSALEDQVRHSQKLESIGLLAGGVAHDFNNLLTPIIGYTDILSLDFPDGDQRRSQLQHIKKAAIRAKEVVQRLLAFSRKQVLELKTIDLGDIIRKFESMLRRTIRENIEINVKISSNDCLIKADQGQIEQVLLNLTINAQDAMPLGGHLMIEAESIDIDEVYGLAHQEIQPGSYAVLTVIDTGVGMDDKTIEHIFEPFYTTKEPGRGTGLGLSTVYGIVKQHGGSISVSAEKGHGSTFKVYLPQAPPKEGKRNGEDLNQSEDIVKGNETILVAEDNEMVQSLIMDMLKGLDYNVLVAEDPLRCIDLAENHPGLIHLLLTDIIMPKMNGKELYDKLKNRQPDLKVVFMSGYASNYIEQKNIIDKDTSFIKKPFSLHKLSHIIRQTLDA